MASITVHLRATDTDAKQADLQAQRQFDALLALIKRYDLRLERMHSLVKVSYDIEVTLSDGLLEKVEICNASDAMSEKLH